MISQLDLPAAPNLVIHGDPHVRHLRSIRHQMDLNTAKLFSAVRRFTAIEDNLFLEASVIDMIITGILDSSPETFTSDVTQRRVDLWASWLDEEIDWNGCTYPAASTVALFQSIRTCLKNHSNLLRQLHKAELHIIHHTRP